MTCTGSVTSMPGRNETFPSGKSMLTTNSVALQSQERIMWFSLLKSSRSPTSFINSLFVVISWSPVTPRTGLKGRQSRQFHILGPRC